MIRPCLYRFCWLWVRGYLVLYHRYRVYNRHRAPLVPGCGMLVASNHCSYIDPLVIGNAFWHPIWYLARSTLFQRSRFFTWLISSLNAIPISRVRLNVITWHRVRELCKQGQWVVIFPEGTRSEDGELHKGLAGVGMFANKIGVDIVPVYHEGTFESWSRYMRFPRPCRIRVNIGSPLKMSQWDHLPDGRPKYQAIADALMAAIQNLKDELQNK